MKTMREDHCIFFLGALVALLVIWMWSEAVTIKTAQLAAGVSTS